MDLTMLLLTIATVVLAGGSFWAAVHYGRKALSEARNANALASERSVVDWHAGRQDQDNPGWFYVANIGEDTAHEVAVIARDRLEHVSAKADHLRPYRNDTNPTAHPSDYIEFRLPKREQEGPMPVKGPNLIRGPEGSKFREEVEKDLAELIDREQRQQVAVTITWRSELGRWSTVEVQTG